MLALKSHLKESRSRKKKTPPKYQDNALKDTQVEDKSKYINYTMLAACDHRTLSSLLNSSSLTVYYFCDNYLLGWCTVLCLEDHKTYTSPVKKLESEDGLGVDDTDIQPGKHVVWFYGGAPNFTSLW